MPDGALGRGRRQAQPPEGVVRAELLGQGHDQQGPALGPDVLRGLEDRHVALAEARHDRPALAGIAVDRGGHRPALLREVGGRVRELHGTRRAGLVARHGGDLDLVEHEVAVLGAARALARQRVVGQHLEAQAGDLGGVGPDRDGVAVLVRLLTHDAQRAVLERLERRAALGARLAQLHRLPLDLGDGRLPLGLALFELRAPGGVQGGEVRVHARVERAGDGAQLGLARGPAQEAHVQLTGCVPVVLHVARDLGHGAVLRADGVGDGRAVDQVERLAQGDAALALALAHGLALRATEQVQEPIGALHAGVDQLCGARAGADTGQARAHAGGLVDGVIEHLGRQSPRVGVGEVALVVHVPLVRGDAALVGV